MKRVSPSVGVVSFSRVMAESDAAQPVLYPAAVCRGGERLYGHLAMLAGGRVLSAPSAGARGGYLDECAYGVSTDTASPMLEAAQRFEAAMEFPSSLSTAELYRLRRQTALSVHPDLCAEPDKRMAEELMKSVNMLVADALNGKL